MFNIITACIRPQNLSKIHDSIVVAKHAYGQPVEIVWHIVLDGLYRSEPLEDLIWSRQLGFETQFTTNLYVNDTYLVKHDSPINVALSSIEKGLVTIVDDDNIMHPNFIKRIYPAYLKGKKGFLFHQQLSSTKNCNNIVRFAKISNIKPGKIDTAQFCFDRSIIDARWDPRSPQPDGAFIQAVYAKNQSNVEIVDDILCHYNFLSTKRNAFNR